MQGDFAVTVDYNFNLWKLIAGNCDVGSHSHVHTSTLKGLDGSSMKRDRLFTSQLAKQYSTFLENADCDCLVQQEGGLSSQL